MVRSKESIKVAGRVESVDISDDMIVVATSNLGGNTWDSSLQVLDFSTKEVVASVKQQSGCADVCWIKSERRAVSAGDNGDVKVYKMDEEAPARLVEVANLEEHDDIVSSVAACRSHDGLVLSGGYDRSVNVWDIDSDRDTSLDTFTGHSGYVTGVEWSAGQDDSQVFASSSTDCSVRVWDRRQPQGCLACHWFGVPALSISWDHCSGELLAVGCEDGTVAVLDRRTLSSPLFTEQTHTGRVNQTAFGPAPSGGGSEASGLLASVGDDGVLAVQRLGDNSNHSRSALHTDYAQALSWSDKNNLVSGGWDAALWAVELEQTRVNLG
ncbi:unnamed protein product [Ectocarpus sp. CCAP 1310/34]|nr:unnamed protein product [Ectocarpus sp. CCAP 1310/34]